MVTPEIKAKIAKVMRMQSSANANEAATASLMLEKLCVQYGISTDVVDENYDPERDEVDVKVLHRGKRLDRAESWVLTSVVTYFNGRLIGCTTREGKDLKIFATKGNHIQIELYFDYIMEVMGKLANKAKADNPYSPRSFKADFRKGFAMVIAKRLNDMKSAKQNDSEVEGTDNKLTLVDKGRKELAAVDQFVGNYFGDGKIKEAKKETYYVKSGTKMGYNAAKGVGLNSQVGEAQVKRLVGG